MLLEVIRAEHLILDRPPASELQRWINLCNALPTCVLVTDVQWWTARLPGSALVLEFDEGFLNEVAGNIRLALTVLDAQPHNSIYVYFNPLDTGEAVRTRVGTILLSEGIGQTLPDLFVRGNFDELEVAILDLAKGRPHGFMMEQFSTRQGGGRSPACTGYITVQPFLRGREHLDAHVTDAMEVIISGRYFPETESRHAKHQTSLRLLHAKNGDRRGSTLVTAFSSVLDLAKKNRDDIDLIVRIPPKPQKSDYLGAFLTGALNQADRAGNDLTRFMDLQALQCIRNYGEQKKAGHYGKRAQNVRGAFAADGTIVRDRVILVVDDVLTSGATMVEATRTLLDAGAKSVIACPIAINQSEINYDRNYELSCPRDGCGGTMRMRFAKNSDGAFWGCDNWRPGSTGCDQMMTYGEGMVAANRLTTREAIMLFGDMSF